VQRILAWRKGAYHQASGWKEGLVFTTLEAVVRTRTGAVGLGIVLFWIVLALGAPIFAPFDPIEMHSGDEFQPPTFKYLFGTDQYGRDLLSRVIFGARISLSVGIMSVGLAAFVGVTTGLVGGYFGGLPASGLMRLWDVILAFPPILVGIAVATLLGSGVLSITFAVAITSMPTFARLSQAQMLAEGGKEYVLAAKACGASDRHIIFRSILPNSISPILVQVTVAMASAVLLEAALSFLGLGAQPPTPSWGLMLSRSRPYLRKAFWWALFPGLAVTTMILGLNWLSDAVRDALDPRHLTKIH
jgi:peptide/nickel transport system permease protein